MTDANTPPHRSDLIKGRTIDLTQTDPLLRLRQLCKQGKYKYNIIWDRFQNGMMMDCEVWYFLGRKRQTLIREVQFVYTTDVGEAQRIIAAIFLQNIGLGVDDDFEAEELEGSDTDGSDIECAVPDIVKIGIKTMNGLLTKAVKDLPQNEILPQEQAVDLLSNVLGAFGPTLEKSVNSGMNWADIVDQEDPPGKT